MTACSLERDRESEPATVTVRLTSCSAGFCVKQAPSRGGQLRVLDLACTACSERSSRSILFFFLGPALYAYAPCRHLDHPRSTAPDDCAIRRVWTWWMYSASWPLLCLSSLLRTGALWLPWPTAGMRLPGTGAESRAAGLAEGPTEVCQLV
ncbi:hypothetical protein JKP88DRAFT_237362 [Tribonema minus]|uniref:Uncharacterized protein n=1 Tax=Tribonema minus TaxID=303371 RepID=A0A835Z0E2_9STRA|nr:hypothetical protein JKP88DRAFT_237362 [Tribonema minus]